MREFKFRAVVIDDDGDKSLRYDVWPHGENVFVVNSGFWMSYERIEQYTGLKDKNGKEIYEGDIISFGRNRNYCVVFEDSSFILMHHGALKDDDHPGLKDFDGTPLRWGLLSRVNELNDFHPEVIGNIHENPELIKE